MPRFLAPTSMAWVCSKPNGFSPCAGSHGRPGIYSWARHLQRRPVGFHHGWNSRGNPLLHHHSSEWLRGHFRLWTGAADTHSDNQRDDHGHGHRARYVGSNTVSALYRLIAPIPYINFSSSSSGVDTTTITTLVSPSSGGIYYTTDGSSPSSSSLKYAGPFLVPSGTTVRAISEAPYFINSPIYTATAP